MRKSNFKSLGWALGAVAACLMMATEVQPAHAEPVWKVRKEIASTVHEFYARYLGATKKPKDKNLVLQSHLTPEFYLSIQDSFEEMDADPVIRSEYIGADYRRKIHVYNVRVDADGLARADVRLGELPQGAKSPNGPVKLRLKLQRVDNRWKIASVDRGFDN